MSKEIVEAIGALGQEKGIATDTLMDALADALHLLNIHVNPRARAIQHRLGGNVAIQRSALCLLVGLERPPLQWENPVTQSHRVLDHRPMLVKCGNVFDMLIPRKDSPP